MRVKGTKRKSGRFILIFILMLLIFICVDLLISKYGLSCSKYEISSEKVDKAIRIVQLTDLHNSEFGFENKRLIEKVAEQSPDLLLITGDLLNSDNEDTSIATSLISELTDIAPVYFSYGNHEKEYELKYGVDICSLYQQSGAKVLEYEYCDIEVNDQIIRLGGIYGYCIPEDLNIGGETNKSECEFINEFQDTDLYTILMCHMPVCWIQDEGLDKWDVDCVVAGHAHGGQIRIPFVGGLWAPDQGLFPGRECGLYYSESGSKVLVLSKGLGSNETIPRFNNVPEILVLDILPLSE